MVDRYVKPDKQNIKVRQDERKERDEKVRYRKAVRFVERGCEETRKTMREGKRKGRVPFRGWVAENISVHIQRL